MKFIIDLTKYIVISTSLDTQEQLYNGQMISTQLLIAS